MNLLLRTLWVLFRAMLRSRLAVLDTSTVRMRVWPNDLDLNFHLNNGRYLSLMDLGRYDLVARNGLLRRVIRERWQPTVASETIRFRRSIAPFQVFELRSRILGWDEKCFYIEQLFVAPSRRGEEIVCAVALVRALFRGREGNVPTRDVLATLGGDVTESPELPAIVRRWSEAEREYSAHY